jgi:hypothetical protein
MINRYIIFFLIIFSVNNLLVAQNVKYIVEPVQFNSGLYDEFSPVFFKDGLVFCSNKFNNSVVSFSNDQNRLYKIFFVKRSGKNRWGQSRSMASEIASTYNDGPATFNQEGTKMYFSRNNSVKNTFKNVNDTTNKLGIFSAELINGMWVNIKPFKYNNEKYSFTTPSLSPDGKRLYFSSDIPGGSGGMDIYFSELKDGEWTTPVNPGPSVNTPKNESFPFAAGYSKLFFSSDGLPGFGQKDVFYTRQIDGVWITPVHLDSAVNTPYDDFGIVADSTFENGFFSSNRRRTDDIFSFATAPEDFSACDSIKKNRYCFTLYDEKHNQIDTIPVTYIWNFSDSKRQTGQEVYHCFPGPGHYSVTLDITDNITHDTIAGQVNYDVDLVNIDQPLIISADEALHDRSIAFEGGLSDLKELSISDFFWDFGDGFKQGGQYMDHVFKKKGDYTVRMGLLGENKTGEKKKVCVIKKIKIN